MKSWLRPPLGDNAALSGLVPGLELTAEWREAVASPHYTRWKESSVDHERVRGAVANRIIRRLRDYDVQTLLSAGDPYWVVVAINVIATDLRWHQSTRIQLNAIRALCRCLRSGQLKDGMRRQVITVIERALLRSVDRGVGEEFSAMTKVARALASPNLIAGLRQRISDAPQLSVRINALRMLDVVEGRPYRRYSDVKWEA